MEDENILRQHSYVYRAQTRYLNPFNDLEFEPDDDFESDEFRMYGFKIKRCALYRAHDWTICPYAHRGERARRRDPLKVPYAAVSCPDYRASTGDCPRGHLCKFTHGVFEYWLHPTKYRTRMCNAGAHCTRSVCFFAHSPQELRVESIAHLPKWLRLALRSDKLEAHHTREPLSTNSVAGPASNTSGGPGLGVIGPPRASNTTSPYLKEVSSNCTDYCGTTKDEPHELKLEFLESLRMWTINSGHYNNQMMQNYVVNWENGKKSDVPNFDWVTDLLGG